MNKLNSADIVAYSGISRFKVDCRDILPSTNTELLNMAQNGAADATVLVSECQTCGRGRFDRKFYSPQGTGVYFSILVRSNLCPQTVVKLTTDTAVAVSLALSEFTDRDVQIKWVNDIYIDDKKVCGILAESSFDAKRNAVDYAVVGIGINILPPKNGFPDDIVSKAGFVVDREDDDIRNMVIGRVLYYFDKVTCEFSQTEILGQYRSRSWLDGKEVEVIGINKSYSAKVIGIDDDMRLIVKTNSGDIEYLSSGEVNVKIK